MNNNSTTNEKEKTNKILLSTSRRVKTIPSHPQKKNFRMPDVRDLSSSRAIRIIQRLGMKIEVEGSGKVVKQIPRPGKDVKRGVTCKLILGSWGHREKTGWFAEKY